MSELTRACWARRHRIGLRNGFLADLKPSHARYPGRMGCQTRINHPPPGEMADLRAFDADDTVVVGKREQLGPGQKPSLVNMSHLSESSLFAGLRDWWVGVRNAELWGTLAWYDVVLRYRRSMLGPLWLTISTGIMLVGMGPLYAMLLGVPIDKFFPHLALGIIFWGFLTGSINEGCGVFFGGAQYLKQPGFPALALVWRSLARNLIQLAHTIILYVPVALWFHVPINFRALLFIPGLIVVVINLYAAMVTLGVITARFRDVSQIVSSILTLMLFLTPVFWFPDVLPERAKLVLYNPFAQLLAIIRLPLLGNYPAPGTIKYMILFTVLNLVIAAFVWAAARRRLVYWV